MSYKAISLCLQSKDCVRVLMQAAENLSAQQPVHVNAVHSIATDSDIVTLGPYFQAVPIHQLTNRYIEIAEEIKSEFHNCQKMLAQTVISEWHSYNEYALGELQPYIDHAMLSDLVICTKTPDLLFSRELPRALVQESGVPVLAIPTAHPMEKPFSNIVIAWNSTPEAARAIRDALPILKTANQVVILNIGGHKDKKTVVGTDIARYLSQHNVSTEIKYIDSIESPGKLMIDYAENNACDLLVMGGYGHSSLYNMIFGAATPTVLKAMQCPVFLSK